MSTLNKILVVDDDPVNRDFFQLMLSKLGFIVKEACDGVDALEKLNEFFPHLILLDNVMPRMDGFEFTKKTRENPKYREIPIIMFSALDDVQDKLAGFQLGADDYITKPFIFSEVLARIKAILRNRELFAQIEVRESRLNLAENLNHYLKQNLFRFAQNVNELDSAVTQFQPELAENILEKTKKIRLQLAELDARIEKTILESEALKKNEIGLSTLEAQIRRFLRQE
ncbi:MAG: response regulator [Treponema sp.]|jgi:DNA-binding response OmpR family regulator|nr:response regulator [Treponema sp.]